MIETRCLENAVIFIQIFVIASLRFKGITQQYLIKISITHNKDLSLLLNLLINCISGRSEPQILSLKDDCTLDIISFLISIQLKQIYLQAKLIFYFRTYK